MIPGAKELLERVGAGRKPFQLVPLSGGANNKVFRVEMEGQAPLVLKNYFFSQEDKRDRFHAEKSFYDILQAAGLQEQIPQALGWDRENRLGLFSWVEGRRLKLEEVTERAVNQALGLYLGLNAQWQLAEAALAPQASEACFDMAQHLATVERRLARLDAVEGGMPLDREAMDFISKRLRPAFERYREACREQESSGMENRRCLSPSDFGFHNALLQGNGKLVFFDFEYAGWDGPAKFLCDFLCQPEVPVPASLREHCIQSICHDVPGGARREQVTALLPIYHIKWCCILLNEFLPQEQKRRVFSLKLSPEELEMKKRGQLGKARTLLDNLDNLSSN